MRTKPNPSNLSQSNIAVDHYITFIGQLQKLYTAGGFLMSAVNAWMLTWVQMSGSSHIEGLSLCGTTHALLGRWFETICAVS